MRLGLAPMEGVSEFPMRLWLQLTSAPDFAVTPFLRVTSSFPGRAIPEHFAPELTALRQVLSYDLLPQMMAASADDFLRVAPFFLQVSATVELNCGCPAPCSVGSGAGSSLLKDPERFARMLERVATHLGPQRFAVKMRTGFHDAANFPALLTALPLTQLARLTVHGRTRAARYTGVARWDLIRAAALAAQATAAPPLVLGSGDIVDGASLQKKIQTAPEVAAVLIGRGALRNPWIFSELRDQQLQATTLSGCVLTYALAVHVLLHELDMIDRHQLYQLTETHFNQLCCGTDQNQWQQVYGVLTQALYGSWRAPASLEVSRIALGRLKMLWSSLRSSLPSCFFEPRVLRATSAGALIAYVMELTRGAPALLNLQHAAALDWLYSGEKKPTTS